MKNDNMPAGHLAAFVTILIWGTTFISTKMLLRTFTPVEILFIRFVMGYMALWIVCPRSLKQVPSRQEWLFAAAGFCGVTMYYLLENVALTFTLASNVGVIISIAPFFTAILNWLFMGGERPRIRFFAGFVTAMAGICLITFGGGGELSLNPTGDILAIAAAVIWAVYSTLTRKIGALGHSAIQSTRRTFFYGILFMIPALFFMDFDVNTAQFTEITNIGNLLFLGLGASALCFVTWNFAVRLLGSVKTSVYIYIVPVITTICSALVLRERISALAAMGIILTLAGLFLSEQRTEKKGVNRLWTAKTKNV